jgi:hypothetical protein
MKPIYPYLTYAGAVPFVFCAVCLAINIQSLPILGSVSEVLSVYTLVIASFLAGSHWGQHLQLTGEWNRSLPIVSNVVAVVLWLSFLVFPLKALLIICGVAFVTLLLIDLKLFQMKLMTQNYFQTRCIVTVIVVSSIVISGVFV